MSVWQTLQLLVFVKSYIVYVNEKEFKIQTVIPLTMNYQYCVTVLCHIFVFFHFNIVACHADSPPKLLLISFDGFRWDYIHKASFPNFNRMINHGAWSTKGIKNAFITKTFPNHFTLVTGLYEESHGMVGNVMFDPKYNLTFHVWNATEAHDSRWFDDGGEPIWVTNQRQSTDHRSGIVMWPGGGPAIKGIQPYKNVDFDAKVPLRHRIDTIIDWFTDRYPINLGLLYFEEPDKCGHEYGPDSEEMIKMIGKLDADLGYLFDMLDKHELEINIIFTSDHGMTTLIHDKEHTLNLDEHISLDSYFIDTQSPIATLRPKSKELGDEILKNLSDIPHLHVYKKEDIPEEFHFTHNRRIDPILLVPEEHYWITHNNSQGTVGNHGYNNSLSSMHPVFMAMGPSFRKGARVEQFNNIDVYPLMCSLLNLTPARNNGSLEVVQELLVDAGIGDTSTFGIYMFILIFTGFISGIFGVAACRVHRQYKRRRMQLRSIPELFSAGMDYTKMDNIPLMPDTSDDEFD